MLEPLKRAWQRSRQRATPARSFDFGQAELLAFSPPEYLGVSQSTRTLFDAWYPLAASDLATAARRETWATAVIKSGARRVVLSGCDDGYAEAALLLKARAPGLRIAALWHGTMLQLADAGDRRHLERLLDLANAGCIDRIGFLKDGMDELFATTGALRAGCYRLANWVERIPETAAPPPGEDVRLGLWFAGASWRKNPYAMLAGAALVPRALVSGVLDPDAVRWAGRLGLRLDLVSAKALDPGALSPELARQHCNLYITLSECSPLLPLESLALGVPCLVAPNSHLFREDDFLHSTLVVDRSDDPHAIAESVRSTVAQRDAVITAYARYALDYNARARELRDRFLED